MISNEADSGRRRAQDVDCCYSQLRQKDENPRAEWSNLRRIAPSFPIARAGMQAILISMSPLDTAQGGGLSTFRGTSVQLDSGLDRDVRQPAAGAADRASAPIVEQ